MEENKSIEVNILVYGRFIGLLVITFIAMIVLKLYHIIDLSWIWVLSPLWIPLTTAIVNIAGFKCDISIKNRK